MLYIESREGESYPLTGFSDLRRNRLVNGEKVLTLFAYPETSNIDSFPLLENENFLEFQSDVYVIKNVKNEGEGVTYYKEIKAVHKFFCDMIDDFQEEVFTGSFTFLEAMHFVFDGTPFNFVVEDSFYAEQWQGLGNMNRLALLNKIIERYGAEFDVVGYTVYLKKEVGRKTSYQYRYKHNVKTISENIDTQNLSTIIKGYGGTPDEETGEYPIQVTYTSPHYDPDNPKYAEPIYDERYTTVEGLTDRLKLELKDEPELSISVNATELRASGESEDAPREGDYVLVIYEPMNLDMDVRVMEIEETFDYDFIPIETIITLSNMRKGLTDIASRISQTEKTVDDIISGKIPLPVPDFVLDTAIIEATDAIKSAQTELEFNNGIIAHDTTDPDGLVVFNSAGLGVSDDGGATFKEAITSKGINTSLLTAGQINTNNIKIVGEENLFLWDAGALVAIDPTNTQKRVKLSKDGLQVSTNGGQSYTVAITGDGVNADVIKGGTITGVTVASTSTIDVSTDLTVGYNIKLGNKKYLQTGEERAIIFNDSVKIAVIPNPSGLFQSNRLMMDSSTIELKTKDIFISEPTLDSFGGVGITFRRSDTTKFTTFRIEKGVNTRIEGDFGIGEDTFKGLFYSVNNRVLTNRDPETGQCGFGMYTNAPAGVNIGGIGVNFRVKRATTPTVELFTEVSTGVSSEPALFTNVTKDGFYLYFKALDGVAGYKQWRGTYKVT